MAIETVPFQEGQTRTRLKVQGLSWAPAALVGLACALPMLAVIALAVTTGRAGVDAAAWRLILESALGLAGLLAVGGGGAVILGAAAAWLVTFCEFPGRRLFDWALILPLAAPAYVLAQAYGGITGPTGPLPIGLTGFWGAAFVYTIGFYPYVYLAARGGFLSQSACALEAAQSLGASPLQAWWRIGLPMARPAIAAGAALAGMEIAADYGAAAFFGAQTLSTGVFHAWYARADVGLALQLASILGLFAVALMALEHRQRGHARYAGGSQRWRTLLRMRLGAASGALAVVFCIALISLGLLAPFGWLLRLALLRGSDSLSALAAPLGASLILAAGGAAITLICAIVLARAARFAGRGARFGTLAASAGYATPGAVVALGALALLAAARDVGLAAGLTGVTAMIALVWTYAARFSAAGSQPILAAYERITPAMAGAAALQVGPWRRFFAIEAPIAAPGLIAAGLIIFVEILRELPATLILRPFNFDTLAIRAHQYASDDRLAQAAAPALLILLAGLLPIALLARALDRSRAGHAHA